jgi:hypothetical protein
VPVALARQFLSSSGAIGELRQSGGVSQYLDIRHSTKKNTRAARIRSGLSGSYGASCYVALFSSQPSMTDPFDDDMHVHDTKESLATLSPFEMITSVIAGRSGLHMLQELASRGITPGNVAQLQSELQNGLAMIETILRSQGIRLPDLDGITIRAWEMGMH